MGTGGGITMYRYMEIFIPIGIIVGIPAGIAAFLYLNFKLAKIVAIIIFLFLMALFGLSASRIWPG